MSFTLLPIRQNDLGSRYHVVAKLGEGAYGTVCSAIDCFTNNTVAIKKIKLGNSVTIAFRTLREIKVLKHLNGRHKNIVKLLDMIKPFDYDGFKDVHLVLEKMDSDLHCAIRLQHLSNEHVRYFSFQMLNGINFLHSCNVIHRDLKPSNLLVNSTCELKITDFGLSRTFLNNEGTSPVDVNNVKLQRRMTEYVATRWYRSPEIIYSAGRYSKSVDMWAAGCIILEMILGKPVFPGANHVEQLEMFRDLLGPLSKRDVELVFIDKYRNLLLSNKAQTEQRISWDGLKSSILGLFDPKAWNLAERLLKFHPDDRLTSLQALNDVYLEMYRVSDSETQIPPSPLNLESLAGTKDSSYDELKKLLWKEF